MDIAEKYFINRIGYNEHKPIADCKDIYEILGYIVITIIKNNEKSFRCDYSNELYKEVPEDWYIYSEERLHTFALNRIAKIFTNDTYYIKHAKQAFNMLDEEDKTKVCKNIKDILRANANRIYENYVHDTNLRITGKERLSSSGGDNIIEKYTEGE